MDPGHAQFLRAAEAAYRAGDLQRAGEIAEQATAKGHENSQLLTLVAYHRMNQGDVERALLAAKRAWELAPQNVDAMNAVGECLTRAGRLSDAIDVFDSALVQAPGDAMLHFNAALALEQNGDVRRACEEFERAFALDSLNVEAASRLAYLLATRGDMARAREFGLRALALDRRQPYAGFAVALADIEDRNFDRAEAQLVEIMNMPQIGRVVRAIARSILGDALHAMGRQAEAFAAYAEAGKAMHELYAPARGAEVEMALARSRRLAAYVAKAPADAWASEPGASAVRSHVFLVGFPRSGTTLLGQILASHPDIAVLEEKRTLTHCADLVATDQALDRFVAMGSAELAPYRAEYWRCAAGHGLGGGRDVLVDKMPLNSELLLLIAKLFPEAKIVFAIRDPRDVVLSCFRRRFNMNRQMYELLTLEGAAAFYDSIMRLGEVYRGKLSLPFLDLRYEALVEDFENQAKRLCSFVGVPYDTALAQFAEGARTRNILTPSATQVVRGLYRQGVGQWTAYRDQLAPVLPVLAPWVSRFGYSEG